MNDALSIACDHCGAPAGQACLNMVAVRVGPDMLSVERTYTGGERDEPHETRVRHARSIAAARETEPPPPRVDVFAAVPVRRGGRGTARLARALDRSVELIGRAFAARTFDFIVDNVCGDATSEPST